MDDSLGMTGGDEHAPTPAIMMGGEEDGMEDAVTPRSARGGQDWQLVDDEILSQCGSSPGSLSHLDLRAACESPRLDASLSVPENAEEPDILPVSDLSTGPMGSAAALQAADFEAWSGSEASAELHAADEAEGDATAATVASRDSQEEDFVDAPFLQLAEESEAEEPLLSEMEAPYSGRSSYANVSLPEGGPTQGEGEELSEGTLLDMLEEMGMSADLSGSQTSAFEDEDLEYPLADIPDTGVFSIATGYPMGTPFERSGSRPLSFATLSAELPEAVSPGSASPSLSTAGSSGRRIPAPPAQLEAEKDRWGVWKHSVTGGRAVALLNQLWRHVQMLATKAGEHVPISVRRRAAAVLRHLANGGTHTCVAYGAALLSFWLAWHYYSRTRALERLTASQSHDYDMHVLKVLAINESLSRGSSMPITRHCGFNPHSMGIPRRGMSNYPTLGLSGARLYD